MSQNRKNNKITNKIILISRQENKINITNRKIWISKQGRKGKTRTKRYKKKK